jgi:hypothetical protein
VVSPAVPQPSASVSIGYRAELGSVCCALPGDPVHSQALYAPYLLVISHCCGLAATRPAPPCWEALRRPRFPPLIAGLRNSWGARISHMRALPADARHPT